MANHTRQLAADAINFTTVDLNAKAEGGAEPPMVQIDEWQDLIGEVFDVARWTETVWPGQIKAGSITEAGGDWTINTGGGANKEIEANSVFTIFNNLDVSMDCNNFRRAETNNIELTIRKDTTNYVVIAKLYPSAPERIRCLKVVGGVATWGNWFGTAATTFKLRIVRTGDSFDFYYDVGGGWVLLQTMDAAIGADCQLVIRSYGTTAALQDRVHVEDVLVTGSDVRWPDSPEADIVDSVNIGVGESYAFDAGAGNTWTLTGASSVQADAGGTNKWKVGFSDAADGTGVTWDAVWRTIAEVNTNAGNGDYDGHRYLYLKWQGNSDGSQNVNATLFTITGRGVNPLAQAHHDRMRRIKYDTSRISP